MITRALTIAALALAVLAPRPAAAAAPLAQQLQAVLDKAVVDHPQNPSFALTVYAPARRIEWTGFSGHVTFGGPPVTSLLSFRVASVTKVFVSTAILRLVEAGKITLAAPISAYIAPETAAQLRGGGYDPDKILVRHLLEHTSGLFDYAMSDPYLSRAAAEPKHRWTRAEQIGVAMTVGKPLGAPGERYHYSDTGYVILGEIIERVSGQPMPAAIRRLDKFDALGLRSTWFETLEPPPAGALPRAHQYYAGQDFYDADPSADLYGGGGIVSITPDLARFYRAILVGQVFERPETLPMALLAPNVLHAEHDAPHAPLLYVVKLGNHQCWGHGGFFGSLVTYCPDIDTAIALTVNANAPGKNTAIGDVYKAVADILDADAGAAQRR